MMTDESNVEFGYTYVYVGLETRIEMVEFHVDYCHGFNGLNDEAPQCKSPAWIEATDDTRSK